MLRLTSLLFMGVILFVLAGCQQNEKAEEQPKAAAKPEISQVKDAIEGYIQENTNAEGYFLVEDAIENRTRNLSFDYIHDSVMESEDGRSFACVDFTEAPGDTLDLDFYVVLDEKGAPKVSEVVIHKVNRESRLKK